MLVSKLSLTRSRCLRGLPISQDIKVLSIRKSRVALLFLKTKFSVRSFAVRKLSSNLKCKFSAGMAEIHGSSEV